MKVKNIALWIRLTSLIFLVISLSVGYLAFQLNNHFYRLEQTKQEDNLIAIGQSLTHNQLVITQLEQEKTSTELQGLITSVEEDFKLSFIVVMTTDSIRLTHPNKAEINQKFQGDDEKYTLQTGKTYISTAKGTMGTSLRGFVPVKNQSGQVIGAIAMGLNLKTIHKQYQQIQNLVIINMVICLILSVIIASAVAFSLKKGMLDMNRSEIKLLDEKYRVMFENVSNAIILTDPHDQIQLINPAGEKIIQKILGDTVIQQKKISDIFPIIKQVNPIKSSQNYFQNADTDYLISTTPLEINQKNIGSLVIIQNISEMKALLGQLNNTTTYTAALQVQTHDFLNKMHVIYGLTDAKEYQKLRAYLSEILEADQEFISRITYLVHNPVIAGFLIQERTLFINQKTNLMLEIYPDIPNSADFIQTQNWMQLIAKIHQIILEQEIFDNLQVSMSYNQKSIESHYQTYFEPFKENRIRQALITLSNDYLLTIANSVLTYSLKEGWFDLLLITPYQEDE
ncbi:MAG: Spo0B domain-containing protein [Streptococcaceae bacterium]|jgi:two-component system CitB family sensor kinase|nr:Spo0B domain-containing protein [Streptococcaceae bacterium]